MAIASNKKLKSFFKHFTESLKLCWQSSPTMFSTRIFFEIFTVVSPILLAHQLKIIVNLLLNKDVAKTDMLKAFTLLILSVIFIRLLTVVLENIKRVFTDNHNELINHNIDKQILIKINDLDISYFDSPEYHNEISNVYNDGRALQDLSFMVISLIRSFFQIFSCAYILFRVNALVPIIVVLLIVPAVFIDNHALKKRYDWERESTLERRKIIYIKSILNGQAYAKDLRIFHTDQYFFEKYENQWKNWFGLKKKVYKKGAMFSTISQLIPHLAVYSILFFIGIKIINNELTVGDFTFYNGIIVQFVGGVTSLFASVNKAYESEKKLSNFSKFLELPCNIEASGTYKLDRIQSIEFKDVSFKYPNTQNFVLNHVSFKLEAGKITALVGENGAGKTTIIKLILRLYDPTNGTILINGINLKNIEAKTLHKAIGVVFQDFNTYELTLREAVAISDIDNLNNNEAIISACDNADFPINNRFSNGFDTYIGKTFDSKGVVLSGGQKQKLAISSAYFKNCSYYIMDEPNSALDPVADNDLISKLVQLSKDHGSLFISHKLSVMHITDEILVLENGRIVESGSHNVLMAKNGVYKKLYLAQAERYRL